MKPAALTAIIALLLGIGLAAVITVKYRAGHVTSPAAGTAAATDKTPVLPPPYGFGVPEYVHAAMIVIGYQSGARPEIQRSHQDAAVLATDLHRKITAKEITFEEAARTFSDAESAEEGGDLGFVRLENIANLEGSFDLFRLKPGEVSPVMPGESAFFLYRSIPYERRYFRIISIRFGTAEGERSEEEARERTREAFEAITSGELTFEQAADRFSDSRTAAGGYVGEIVPGSAGGLFESAVKDLPIGGISPVCNDRSTFVIAQRCPPIQFTFTYVVFPGLTDDADCLADLQTRAADFIAAARKREDFYARALDHYRGLNWDAPWYRISKDLFANKLADDVYRFLAASNPGDISAPITFKNGVYVLMKEEFIGYE